ncbi:hypothetical protein DFR70_12651 [Nocardia tenerifensis]|uniref:Uncharacterized protein n=1 Tax=Nocardia tenerifensis TaxID=228006 RepID=A0A318JSE0_9NOCA|nr:hypothetical protein [Nocardia tenerifensis]PXX53930.1 hypothetical protein DFR70_12651 [Nocardia tenerifensis]
MSVLTRSDLVPVAVVVVNIVVLGHGFIDAVGRGDRPAVAGYSATFIGLYVMFRWWRRERRAWWHSPEFRACHAEFVSRLTALTGSGSYLAWHAGTRQWLKATAHTTLWTVLGSGRRYFTVDVVDDPEPSLGSGETTELDYSTSRCFLVFPTHPRIDIHVAGALEDPQTGTRQSVAGAGRRGSTVRAVLARLRTPAAARVASTSDIDVLLELLDSAEPRAHR